MFTALSAFTKSIQPKYSTERAARVCPSACNKRLNISAKLRVLMIAGFPQARISECKGCRRRIAKRPVIIKDENNRAGKNRRAGV